MPKEILLYSIITSESATAFINQVEESIDDDITLRINGDGGVPEDGWGMIAKWSEHKGNNLVKVDGRAHSMYAFFLCYCKDSEGLDVSQYLIHRAGYSEWLEKSEYMTSVMWENLDKVNKKLRQALEAKIDVAKFEKITGVTMNQLFSNESRLDVVLDAKQAKSVGLINRIINITPDKKAEVNALLLKISAQSNGIVAPKEVSKPKIHIMDLVTLKTEHPNVYAAAVAEGEKLGIAKERDRVEAHMAFVDVDPVAVAEGIAKGEHLSAKSMAELTRKSVSKEMLSGIQKDSSAKIVTEEQDVDANKLKTEKEKQVSEFEKAVQSNLKKSA